VLGAALVGNADLEAARLVPHLERHDFFGIESHGRGIVAVARAAP
jgi:hypothetical protein